MQNTQTEITDTQSILTSLDTNIGRVSLYNRWVNDLRQSELADSLCLDSRHVISAFENGTMNASPHTLLCLLADANLHPIIKLKEDAKSTEICFPIIEHPKEGYASFITKALKEKGMTVEELYLSKASKKRILMRLPIELFKDIMTNKITDEDIKSHRKTCTAAMRTQLLLSTYVTGVNTSEMLVAARKSKNLLQKDLATMTGLSLQSISNFESELSLPSPFIWATIMIALDIHPNYERTGTGKDIPSNFIEILETKIAATLGDKEIENKVMIKRLTSKIKKGTAERKLVKRLQEKKLAAKKKEEEKLLAAKKKIEAKELAVKIKLEKKELAAKMKLQEKKLAAKKRKQAKLAAKKELAKKPSATEGSL